MQGRILSIAAAAAAWILAGVLATLQIRTAFRMSDAGLDFTPIRHAVEALVDGRSIYTDARFVYPPTAAPVLLPYAFGSFTAALHQWIILSLVAVVGAVVLAVARLQGAWWPLLAAVGGALLVVADLTSSTLWLGNISLFIAPIAVGVLLCFETQHWSAGCALLAASLLVKPILAPLLLLPILRRQWRALVLAGVPAVVVLAIAVVVLPGADDFTAVLRRLSGGGELTGDLAIYNLSLKGLGERLDAAGIFAVLRVAAAAVALAGVFAWYRQPRRPGATAAAGVCILLGVFLAGALSENHFLLIAVPCLLLALVSLRDRRALLCATPGLVVLFVPFKLLDVVIPENVVQVRNVSGEVLLLIAAVVATVTIHAADADRADLPSLVPADR